MMRRKTRTILHSPLQSLSITLLVFIVMAFGSFNSTKAQWTTNSNDVYKTNTAGNVGIGTTNPQSKLEIDSGDLVLTHVSGDTGKKGIFAYNTPYSAEHSFSFTRQNTVANSDLSISAYAGIGLTGGKTAPESSAFHFYINPSGNVGIGTTSPDARFHVTGGSSMSAGWNRTGTLDATFPVLSFKSGAGSSAKWAGVGYDYSVDALRFWTGAASNDVTSVAPTMTLSAGKVGIGASTPQRTLDVGTSGQMTFGNDGYSSTGSPGLFWYSDNINYGIYKSAGSWSAPNYQQLNVNFPTGIVIDGGSAYGKSGTVLQPNGGNVGIGTANPGSKLDVNGNIFVRDLVGTGTQHLLLGYLNGAGRTIADLYSRDQVGVLDLSLGDGSISTRINGSGNSYFNAGNVGIGTGTTGPSEKLEVNGNLKLIGTGNINATGTIEANNIKAKYQDVAEWVPSSEQLSAGTVVVLDSTKSNQVTSSTVSYDTRVAGVVSEQPGIALGEKSEGKVLVATTGRVRVKVDATKSPIHIGDLLVTSDVPGVAMKSEPVEFAGRKMHMPGTLIGKAQEPLEKGKGEIVVLLSLQ